MYLDFFVDKYTRINPGLALRKIVNLRTAGDLSQNKDKNKNKSWKNFNQDLMKYFYTFYVIIL